MTAINQRWFGVLEEMGLSPAGSSSRDTVLGVTPCLKILKDLARRLGRQFARGSVRHIVR